MSQYDPMYGTKAKREAAEASLVEFDACKHDWHIVPPDGFSDEPYEHCPNCGGARTGLINA